MSSCGPPRCGGVTRGGRGHLPGSGAAGRSKIGLVSRVVALGGDEIGDAAGLLTINGPPADEAYLPAGTTTPGLTRLKIREGHVFLMGDNRKNSRDSRSFGPLPNENVRRLVCLLVVPRCGTGGLWL